MSRIGAANTKPEVAVRSLLHGLGYRFRLHRRDLPGTPDIVLPRYRTAVFVHGCFWRGHFCKRDKMPKSRTEYREGKIAANRRRDARARRRLRSLGWKVVIVWECELGHREKLARRLCAERGDSGRPNDDR